MAKTLNEWARDIHQNAVEHGWWDEPRSFGDIVALCHSELSEALEEYRNGKPMIYGCCGHCDKETQCEAEGKPEHSCKPEGIATEMVDCLIRILDWCGSETEYSGCRTPSARRKRSETGTGGRRHEDAPMTER